MRSEEIGTYTHLSPRSLQLEQDTDWPLLEIGRSFRSQRTLWWRVSGRGDVK